MSASNRSEEPNGWLIRNKSVYHPDYFPDGEGVSLQEVRDYYLWHQKSELDSSMEAAPWYIVNPSRDAVSHLCNVCRYVNFRYLLSNTVFNDFGPILYLRHMLAHRDSCRFCNIAVAALCTANGELLGVDDLEDGNYVLGCWITCNKLPERSDGPAIMSIWRRKLFVNGGFVGYAGFIQEIGSDEDNCLGRQVLDHTPLDLVKSWIATCERSHCDAVVQAGLLKAGWKCPGSMYQLRVIDVRSHCIVAAASKTRYVALSYVWGQVSQLKLLRSNLAELSTEGALVDERFGKKIPRTISDAMRLVARLGERYLWVDALCLVQDGPEFAAQVQDMDNLYGQAAWTLVAGSARHAETHLPRMAPQAQPSSIMQYRASIRDQAIGVLLPSLLTVLQTTAWNDRAWTYQESALSKRLLIVAEPQMYFTCQHGFTFCEDMRIEDESPSGIDREGQIFGSKTSPTTNFEVYAEAVTEYTRRQMSFHEDGLNAVSGVLNQLRPWFRGDFLSGLPSTELDQALLWYPKGNTVRRTDQVGGILFPSWSWAGWVGQVEYWTGLAISGVKWKLFHSNPPVYCTTDELRTPSSDHDEEWYRKEWSKSENYPGARFGPGELYDGSWFERQDPTSLFLHPVAVEVDRRAHLNSRDHKGLLELRGVVSTLRITGNHSVARAFLNKVCSGDEHELCALNVYDAASNVCGTVHVPATLAASLKPGAYDFLRLSRTHLLDDPTRPSDVRWNHEDATFKPMRQNQLSQQSAFPSEHSDDESTQSLDMIDEGCVFDTDVFDPHEPWCVFNVMLIDTVQQVSRRVGLGKVHAAAFTREAGAQWQDILLG